MKQFQVSRIVDWLKVNETNLTLPQVFFSIHFRLTVRRDMKLEKDGFFFRFFDQLLKVKDVRRRLNRVKKILLFSVDDSSFEICQN